MPLVKYTSYRDIPYSPETPADEFHSFVSIRQMVAKLNKHQNHMFKVRSIGNMYSENSIIFWFREIDDEEVKIRLSFAYMQPMPPPPPPNLPKVSPPCSVQIHGQVRYIQGANGGPTLFATILLTLRPNIATQLRNTMAWVVDHHYSQPDVNTQQKRKLLRAARRAQIALPGVCCDAVARLYHKAMEVDE